AQPGVGVDIGGAQPALDQLVDHVIVLGQQLSGYVESYRLGAMLVDDPPQTTGDMIQRLIPAGGVCLPIAVTQQRMKQSPFQPDGIGQRRALYAEPPAVGRMLRIALDAHSVGRLRIQRRDDPTTHAAVGTGGTGHATFSAGVWIISAEESSKVVTSDA